MTTTREKLIEAASRAAMYSEVVTPEHGDVARVDNWPEVIDAILDTLREPSPDMVIAGVDAIYDGESMEGRYKVLWAFIAMINRVRSEN